MKITFVLPHAGLQGGIRVIAIYAERLRARGHDVTVVSTPQVFTLRRKLKSLALGLGLPKPEPSYFDRTTVRHHILEADRSVTDSDVPDGDVVLATYFTTAPGVLELSPRKGAKAIFIQNYEMEEGKPNAQLDLSWRMPMHKITISKWLVDLARDTFGDTVVSHVPNSVDVEQFHAPVRGKQRVPTVGLLYNPFSLKGMPTSLEALGRLAAEFPQLRVISFGARQPTSGLPLPRSAEFHYRPPQDALRQLYAECDVWMCGSNVEGFHLPPLEAMACRCPVVSTRVGGPLDIIEEGVNGHLVDVKDAEALAARVSRVLSLSEDSWKAMSDAAYRTATHFSWDQATGLFEEALRFAIERSHRGDFASANRASSRATT
jgi:glycosyltransferase involved in cell wall biosynthesis